MAKLGKRPSLPAAKVTSAWTPPTAKEHKPIRVKLDDGRVASTTFDGSIVVGEDLAVGAAADDAQAVEQLVRKFAAARKIAPAVVRSILLRRDSSKRRASAGPQEGP